MLRKCEVFLLCLSGYYRRFVEGFSILSRPLSMLTQKGKMFVWSDDCETSFRLLQEKLTTAPVLTLPTVDDKYVVFTDASLNGLGCVLMQEGKVIAYNRYFT